MTNFTPSEFWKNFQLGTELSISGNFIYNGLYFFDTMQHFCYEDEIFEVIYNLSVGIERLQKVTLILLEHNDNVDQTSFESKLITHNHSELNNRIIKYRKINFGKQHLEFLSLITRFYKTNRYEKFNLDSIHKFIEERNEFITYIEKSLNIDISIDFMGCTSNSNTIKKFIGNIVGKFCKEYFEIIKEECHRLNIYITEFPNNSKGLRIFWGEKYTFFEDRQIKKEIIKYLVQSKLPDGFTNFINEEPPLELEYYQVNHYINYLIDFHKTSGIKGEIEELYSEIKNTSKRIRHLDFIGDSDIDFEYNEDE